MFYLGIDNRLDGRDCYSTWESKTFFKRMDLYGTFSSNYKVIPMVSKIYGQLYPKERIYFYNDDEVRTKRVYI